MPNMWQLNSEAIHRVCSQKGWGEGESALTRLAKELHAYDPFEDGGSSKVKPYSIGTIKSWMNGNYKCPAGSVIYALLGILSVSPSELIIRVKSPDQLALEAAAEREITARAEWEEAARKAKELRQRGIAE